MTPPKSICRYCTYCKPLTETIVECCFKPFEHRAIKPTKATCKWCKPRTYLEADTRHMVISFLRNCLGSQSYLPDDCIDFLRGHIAEPGVQNAIPILINDLEQHIHWEEEDEANGCTVKDRYLPRWKELLEFIKQNRKGDKA